MRYVIRAIKYFIYITCLAALIICTLILLKLVQADLDTLFVNGEKSLWMILGIFAVFSAIYPAIGYSHTMAHATGSILDRKIEIINFMQSKGYILDKVIENGMTFHRTNFLQRLTRSFFEDEIVVKGTLGGFDVSGLRKDAVPLAYGLSYALRDDSEKEGDSGESK